MTSDTSKRPQLLPLPLQRALALGLMVSVLGADRSWTSGVSHLARGAYSTDLKALSISSRLGVVTERWAPVRAIERTAPLIVLIQDLHANVGVQKKIARLIEYLSGRFHVRAVCSEAAFGVCDVSLFRSISRGMLPPACTSHR